VTLMSDAFPRTHEFAGVPAVFAAVRAADRYSVKVIIPPDRDPGTYRINARCGGGSFATAAKVAVIAAA